MDIADSTRGRTTRHAHGRTLGIFGCVSLIFIYYWALLSDGKFLSAAPVHYGLVFNSMIDYMSHGRFDVDPATILREGFTHDGRTYAYFGVVPALLRLPLLVFPRFRGIDFTVVACAIAATLAAAAKLAAVSRAGRSMAGTPGKTRVLLFAMVIVIFGGAQVQFARPSIFQESLNWASAVAAIFVLLAFRWCVAPLSRKRGDVMVMALVAGLCLLTRVSTSLGPYAACGGIMLTELITMVWRRHGQFTMPPARELLLKVLLPSLILIAFAAACGYINYQRWGSPFTFQDYRYYDMLEPNDPVFEVLRNYGYFNFARIPFALSYFFVPIWTFVGSDGHFLFRELQDRMYFTVEAPPASILLSDMLLCFLAVLGAAWLWGARPVPIDRPAARLVAIGLMLPGLFMLMAVALTFRYRMEFYPFLEFLGLFGLLILAEKFAAYRVGLTRVCGSMVAISVLAAHMFLVSYKIAPWGDSVDVEKIGWLASWRENFQTTYPGLTGHHPAPAEKTK
jgi:hypothetical protein